MIIDDDVELCNLLKQCLGNEGYNVNCLYDGKTVISFIKSNPIDLVRLDVMLPETDGFTVLRQIRQFSNVPVLMLSAKGDEMNKDRTLVLKGIGVSELTVKKGNLEEYFLKLTGGVSIG